LTIAFGFAMVWHIWWLAIVSFIGIVATVIHFGFDEDNEYIIPADEVKRIEDERFATITAAMSQTINEKEEPNEYK
jgi:cytochrome o ubiquinol oxidase subunit 1